MPERLGPPPRNQRKGTDVRTALPSPAARVAPGRVRWLARGGLVVTASIATTIAERFHHFR
jgi:hypothetical protein